MVCTKVMTIIVPMWMNSMRLLRSILQTHHCVVWSYMQSAPLNDYYAYDRMLFALDIFAEPGRNVVIFMIGKPSNENFFCDCIEMCDDEDIVGKCKVFFVVLADSWIKHWFMTHIMYSNLKHRPWGDWIIDPPIHTHTHSKQLDGRREQSHPLTAF